MKKFLCGILAASMVVSMGVMSFAADTAWTATVYNSDGEPSDDCTGAAAAVAGTGANVDVTIEAAIPTSEFYIALPADLEYTVAGTPARAAQKVEEKYLIDKDYWKFDSDKDVNGKLVSSISLVSEKVLGDLARASYVKIVLADTNSTSEQKTSGTITFEARKDSTDYDGDKLPDNNTNVWVEDDTITIDYTIWVSNEAVGNDDHPETGDRVYMDPESNETNCLIWGDDRAALEFESDDDAGKFYARLSTKSDSTIYAEYGDPVGADLWFYDFVGNPTVPSTSRATLTLGIPWDEDDDYVPDPENVYIYEVDADGYLVDVTSNFSYSEDEEEIAGWSTKTRTLGTYIVSDMELDVDYEEEEDTEAPEVSTPDKEIPSTGSSDMVSVAVVAGVVALAAAGAVAFKKH